jgi:hypothetical protein
MTPPPAPLPLPPCASCGATMPTAALHEVYIRCRYCGHTQATPPPPPSAWIAQHQAIVKSSLDVSGPWHKAAASMSSFAILAYVLFVGGMILVGIILAIVRGVLR